MTITRLRRIGRLAFIPALALAAACENQTSVIPDVIAGSYHATTFKVTPGTQPQVDVLAAGGSLDVTVGADSTLSGTLHIPAGLLTTPAGEINADMTGKLVRNRDGTYTFTQAASTFVRQLAWQQFTDSFVSSTLVGDTQFLVILQK